VVAAFFFSPDIPAGTPAVVVQNDVAEDDDDEPPLNENDDDDLDDVDEVEEQNTQHLVLAQFDKVTLCACVRSCIIDT
jgi:transcription initiation factor TFIIA large subunit